MLCLSCRYGIPARVDPSRHTSSPRFPQVRCAVLFALALATIHTYSVPEVPRARLYFGKRTRSALVFVAALESLVMCVLSYRTYNRVWQVKIEFIEVFLFDKYLFFELFFPEGSKIWDFLCVPSP